MGVLIILLNKPEVRRYNISDRKTAAEFSFILAVPTMFAASALDIVKTKGNNAHDNNSPYEKLELKVHTENMDKEDDKAFTEKILSLLGQYLIVAE